MKGNDNMFNVTSINILVAAEDKESLLKTTESFVHNKQLAVNGYWLRPIDKSSRSKRELLKSLGITRRLSAQQILIAFFVFTLFYVMLGCFFNWKFYLPLRYLEPKHAYNLFLLTASPFFILIPYLSFLIILFRNKRVFAVAKKHLTDKRYFLFLECEKKAGFPIESDGEVLFCGTTKQLIKKLESKEKS